MMACDRLLSLPLGMAYNRGFYALPTVACERAGHTCPPKRLVRACCAWDAASLGGRSRRRTAIMFSPQNPLNPPGFAGARITTGTRGSPSDRLCIATSRPQVRSPQQQLATSLAKRLRSGAYLQPIIPHHPQLNLSQPISTCLNLSHPLQI